ncbi:DUF748 domain-containing protein [Paraburkholderia caribensis]|uniref:DUF748 domain-containing protein n=1 Tax=Paraburkholderia caribensis TaxID=75105 RepID=A0A9Q6S123_9BURK|nr:DUF748 domain-containing protein [Paraburkholderia caribensis]MCO4883168.1 DUF748 domain-containing protein [Paraburkholderia caribensis]PTB25388.1 hypothetical protein C9I56_28520 [Paraburkholderia caribensis]QLB62875.1 hypothetical protein A9O66_11065 [Paraburkholderia caribensis]
MAMSMGKRVTLAVAGAIVLLAVVALGGWYFVQHEVKERVAEALAPLGTAERIDVGLSAITLRHVRLTAPSGWPTPDALTADEITMTPDIRDLLAHRVHLQSVVVRGFSLVLVRTASGRLEILPKLRQAVSRPGQPASEASSAADNRPPLPAEKLIDHIAFADGQFVFYDEMIRKPPYKVTVSDASATVDHIHLPDLTEPTRLSVKGSIKGPAHTGTVTFDGWMKIASKDSQTTTTLRGVDVVTLDPYLLKKAGTKTQVTGGTLDLNLQATVTSYHIHAPGTVTLHHLQLAATDDPLDTFMQIPARAAVAALKKHGDDITLHFVIDGNLRDPKFKLNESVMTELRANFAKALGVSAEGVAKGAGETVKGLGNALKNLLGQ